MGVPHVYVCKHLGSRDLKQSSKCHANFLMPSSGFVDKIAYFSREW
jgi:hypothetical protein